MRDQTWQLIIFLDVWIDFHLAHEIIFWLLQKKEGEKV